MSRLRKKKKKVTEDRNVLAFVRLVRRYVLLIETMDKYSAYDFLRSCAVLLPGIYSTGLFLPEARSKTRQGWGKIDKDYAKKHSALMNKINEKIGPLSGYYVVFDPHEKDEPVYSSIGDDLTDIYSDLARPLADFERRSPRWKEAAIWDWRFTLQCHAGDHIVSVMRPIHRIIQYRWHSDFSD